MPGLVAFLSCVLIVLAYAAVIVAVYFLIAWALQAIFTVAIPPRVTQLLGVALLLLVIVGILDCLSGGGHFAPWRVDR